MKKIHYSLNSSFQFLKVIYRTIRFSSTLCFTSATFIGAIVASLVIDFKMISLLIFSGFSTAFGFILNDLSDTELDKSAGVMRNPFSTNELSKMRGILTTGFLLLVSIASLFSLNLQNQLLGSLLLFLYFTYSWIVRAKAKPVFDILYHGSCLAILVTIGYIEYRSFDFIGLLLASLFFSASAMSQILQEVRDYKSDQKMVRTTVILLGKKKSLVLCLALFTCFLTIFISLLFYTVFPFETLLLSPVAIFYLIPIIKSMTNEEYEHKIQQRIHVGRLPIISAFILLIIFKRVSLF